MVNNDYSKVAEVKLTYTPNYKVADRPKITTSNAAYSILIEHWDKGRIEFLEEFKIILLNRRNKVLGIVDISLGGITGTVVDPRIVFGAALKACASGIILAHNHPSGVTSPSAEDIALTKKLVQGGLLLEISILEHLIVTTDGYYSFADNGLM